MRAVNQKEEDVQVDLLSQHLIILLIKVVIVVVS